MAAPPAAQGSSPSGMPVSPAMGTELSEPLARSEDIRVALSALDKCTTLAAQGRKKDQVTFSIKQMERALSICKPLEGYTVINLAAATARLNLSAAFSRGGRHNDAVSCIKAAQDNIEEVLAGRTRKHRLDPDPAILVEQAHTLQAAAIMAEGIEVESFNVESGIVSTPTEPSLQEQIFADAHACAEANLHESHPAVALAKKLHESAVCAPKEKQRRYLGTKAPSSPSKAKEPPTASAEGAEAVPVEQESAPAPMVPQERSTLQPEGAEAVPAEQEVPKAKKAVVVNTPPARQRAVKKKDSEQVDVFTGFLRDIELAKEARRAGFFDVQEENRKKLDDTRRMSKLQMMAYKDDVEIHDVLYSRFIHNNVMKTKNSLNLSRSDPVLLKEARRFNESPEVIHARKFRMQMQMQEGKDGPRMPGFKGFSQ